MLNVKTEIFTDEGVRRVVLSGAHPQLVVFYTALHRADREGEIKTVPLHIQTC